MHDWIQTIVRQIGVPVCHTIKYVSSPVVTCLFKYTFVLYLTYHENKNGALNKHPNLCLNGPIGHHTYINATGISSKMKKYFQLLSRK